MELTKHHQLVANQALIKEHQFIIVIHQELINQVLVALIQRMLLLEQLILALMVQHQVVALVVQHSQPLTTILYLVVVERVLPMALLQRVLLTQVLVVPQVELVPHQVMLEIPE